MFYQILLSPQVKRWAIVTYKHGIYELPHELPNDHNPRRTQDPRKTQDPDHNAIAPRNGRKTPTPLRPRGKRPIPHHLK